MYSLLRFVPKNHLSFVLGGLAALRLPWPLRLVSLRMFAKLARLDLSEAERPLEEYASIGELFIRKLKPGARPIEAEIVSPVDGTLRDSGVLEAGLITQVKGKQYSVAELVHDEALAQKFSRGQFFNLYLAPDDYHRVHSPCSGNIVFRRYIPGKLWPVNDWSISRIEKLFAVNERVVIGIQTARGLVLVVMVGATNVGKISLSFDDLVTNRWSCCSARFDDLSKFSPGIEVRAGDELGVFHLGSSVVLLFEDKEAFNGKSLPAAGKIKMGRTLAR